VVRCGPPDPQTACTRWDQVEVHDVRRWMVWLLGLYSGAYASNQYRALQQFFKWLAEEEDLADPMARLHPPVVTEKLVPVFTSEELSKLGKACQGRSFAQRRDAAIIAVFTATGIRAAELAGIRYDAHDSQASDVDLWQREITVRGKGGKVRVVKITHDAARPGPLHPGQGQARPGVAAPVVAGGEQPRAADVQRHLPDGCPPRPRVRGCGPSAPVPAPFQPYLAGPRGSRSGPDGAERLVLPSRCCVATAPVPVAPAPGAADATRPCAPAVAEPILERRSGFCCGR
jgi:hypothetical protein